MLQAEFSLTQVLTDPATGRTGLVQDVARAPARPAAVSHRGKVATQQRAPAVRAWAAANDVELVFLPTYPSWLNWIEAEFAALRQFALNALTTAATPCRTKPSLATYIGANRRASPSALRSTARSAAR
jgi:hypothetical protein